MGPKIMDCVFMKYAYNSNAYQFLVLKSSIEDIHLNTIMKLMNDILFEGIVPFKKVMHINL
jgi:hypothetical protein